MLGTVRRGVLRIAVHWDQDGGALILPTCGWDSTHEDRHGLRPSGENMQL